MPELPEVEVVRQKLTSQLQDLSPFKSVQVLNRQLRFPIKRDFEKMLVNRTVVQIDRRAKYLLWRLDNQLTMLTHLGMTGSWRKQSQPDIRLHDHLILQTKSDEFLIYNDPRRFGFVEVFANSNESQHLRLKHLGPEPLDRQNFHNDYLVNELAKRTAPIKAALMDQKLVVGVGNIYASEALFLSGIKPTRPANKVSPKLVPYLIENIRSILASAINRGGTSFRDFRSLNEEKGYFQIELKVYDREGEACTVCSNKIKNVRLASRSSFYCPRCQK